MTEAMKGAGLAWGKFTDAQKKPYKDQNEISVKRFERQMQELTDKGYFNNDDGINALKSEKDPKRKYGPTVMLPKNTKSAYFIFMIENMKIILEKDKMKVTEATKKIAEMWKVLPEKKVKLYEQKKQADRKRYEK